MWIVSNIGLFSIVAKEGDLEAGMLTIRARQRQDLEDLRAKYLPTMTAITRTKGADYAWRARANRDAVGAAVGLLAASTGYSNFKAEVGRVQGPAREAIYHRAWEALRALQR